MSKPTAYLQRVKPKRSVRASHPGARHRTLPLENGNAMASRSSVQIPPRVARARHHNVDTLTRSGSAAARCTALRDNEPYALAR